MPYDTLPVDMKPVLQIPDRSLVLWLIAAIVTIAGFCMPAPASAHAGHGHDSAAEARSVGLAVDSLAARVTPPHRQALVAPAGEFGGTASVVEASALKAEGHLACAGSCCSGGCGAACCALGLAPAEGDPASPPGLTGPVPPGILCARTDVAPDSPSEPPRSFA